MDQHTVAQLFDCVFVVGHVAWAAGVRGVSVRLLAYLFLALTSYLIQKLIILTDINAIDLILGFIVPSYTVAGIIAISELANALLADGRARAKSAVPRTSEFLF